MAEKRAATKAARAAREAEERCTGQRSMAFAQTQDHVRRRLRAPSTAKFPWSDYHVTAYRDCTYEVLAHVDAQNGFGAMVRTNYVARMKVDPNTDRWTLLELNLL